MIEKLFVSLPAAVLTAGVISNLQDSLPVDPEIKDPATQAENSMAWEIYRIFYHAIARALESTDWPVPKVDLDGLLAGTGPVLAQGLQTLLTGSGPLAQVVQQLLKAIPTPPPASGPAELPSKGELK
jgi:hypothetical protein